jgi:AraC-like DNA-binding protein
MEFLDVLLLIGSAQGFFLAVFLLHRHRGLYATRFLATLLLIYSVVLLHLFIADRDWYNAAPRIMLLLSGLSLVSGPLHYLYARHLIDPARRLRQSDVLHGLPYLLYLLAMMPLFLLPAESIIPELFSNPWHGFPRHFMVLNWVLVAQALSYIAATLMLLFRYEREVCELFSCIDRVRLKWLRNITLVVLAGWAAFLMENILLATGLHSPQWFGMSGVLGTVCVYVMGYLGLTASDVFSDPEVDASIREIAAKHESRVNTNTAQRTARYEKSGLSEERAEDIIHQLLDVMEKERPHSDSDLTLPRLAERLEVSPHNLSEVINTRTGMNFFDFINSYRVDQVKRDLADPEKRQYKVLALAFDAGFSSKTSFNTIFKKFTGITPSEWRERAGSVARGA